MRPKRQQLAVGALVALLCGPSAAQPITAYEPDPRPEAYAADNEATLAPAGQIEIDGRRMSCGSSPTLLDTRYSDFGGAFRGFIILNPRLFGDLQTPVKLWIYSHECAHQSVGKDEVKADCVAVQRGRVTLTCLAFNTAQVYLSRMGEKLSAQGIRRLRYEYFWQLGPSPAVIYIGHSYAVFPLEELLRLLGHSPRHSLTPRLPSLKPP